MKESFVFLIAVFAVLAGVHLVYGAETSQALGFGLVAVCAAMIAVTFLWLWRTRATPLALGMVFSWLGTATLLGWYWIYQVTGRPEAMADAPLVLLFLAAHITGAVHHFAVLQRSMRVGSIAFVLPVIVAGVLGYAAVAAP